jgi:adenylate cyclase
LKRKTITVGFADMANFSQASQIVGEEGILEILNESYQIVGDIILKHGGVIRKYIGDSILFSFADTTAAEKAGREIASAYRKNVKDLILRHFVSIATGEVWVGKIGHPSLMVDDVIGWVVNRAAMGIKEAHKAESGFHYVKRE